jgi:hypothetical protein
MPSGGSPPLGPNAGTLVEEGDAPLQTAIIQTAPVQAQRTLEPGIGSVTDNAGERVSFAPLSINLPPMRGILHREWAPKQGIEPARAFMVKDIVSTMRKFEQTICKKLAPQRHLIYNGAVLKADGKESVASSWIDIATRVRKTGAAI